MIDHFKADGYGCLQSVEVGLTPLHAFVGPNDSGKSTLLRGIRTLHQLLHEGFRSATDPFDSGLPEEKSGGVSLRGRAQSRGFHCQFQAGDFSEGFYVNEGESAERGVDTDRVPWPDDANFATRRRQAGPDVRATQVAFGRAALIHFDPDALRQPSPLIPESDAIRFLDDRGCGLPGVYQAILGRGDDAFKQISQSLRNLFSDVKYLRVQAISPTALVLEVELTDGTRIRADRMSEGMLYYLGFAALLHFEPAQVLLVEEPENGLHPSRIKDVVAILRTVVEQHGRQVLIATHSPLVINELKPEEVSVVTRRNLEKGTEVTPIADTPNFAQRSSVYALGELWLSYADGRFEQPLLSGDE